MNEKYEVIAEFDIRRDLFFTRSRNKIFSYLKLIGNLGTIICAILLFLLNIYIYIKSPTMTNLGIAAPLGFLMLLFILIFYAMLFNKRKVIFTTEGIIMTGSIFRPKGFLFAKWSQLPGYKIDFPNIILLMPSYPITTDCSINLGDKCEEAAKVLDKFVKRIQ